MNMASGAVVCLAITFALFVVETRCRSFVRNEQSIIDRQCIKAHAWHCPLPVDDDNTKAGVTYKEWINDIHIIDGFPEPEKIRPLLKIRKDIQLTNTQLACKGLGGGIQSLRHLFRQNFENDTTPSDDDVELKITRMTFDGVDVKLYEPRTRPSERRPGLVYFHGGGWTMGSADSTDVITRTLAKKANIIIASVNYRLSPEYVFPIPLQDCVTAAKFFLRNADRFSVDENRIALAGDGAGGNLAAAVTLKLRDENWSPGVKMQMLFYPALQAFDFDTDSYVEHACDAWIPRDIAISFWLWYAYGTVGSFNVTQFALNEHTTAEARAKYAEYFPRSVNTPTRSRPTQESKAQWAEIGDLITLSYFSPLMAMDVGGQPLTYVVTCEQDVFREDGFMYVKRLRAAGVRVAHAHYLALHDFLTMRVDYARRALENAARYIVWNL